jgi:RNA polymerase sigma-70 factor (ECF subfamily)
MTPPGQSGSTSVKAGADTASTHLSDMVPQVYAQLRELARQKMAQERDDHTLQTTALVHEAYLRLFGSGRVKFQSRQHFFRAAAEAMRRILVEHARGRGRVKRGGRRERVPLDLADAASEMSGHDLLALDDLIDQLSRHSPDGAAIVRLRFYVGLSLDETAEALGVNPRTVDREWKYAKAWLYRRWKAAEP